MSVEELKATIRRVLDEAFNKGNLDVLDELYVADCVYHLPPFPDIKGLEAFKQFIINLRNAFPDLQLTISEIIIEEDKCSIQYTCRGTHKGEWMGIVPTGKQLIWMVYTLWHLVEGKVVEDWAYYSR